MGFTIEPGLLVSVITIVVGNGVALAGIFINLNVKIAEGARDNLALKLDLEEHKMKNKDDIKELKEIIMRDKADNRDDHKAIIAEVSSLAKNLADFKVEIIKAIQKSR